jgi:hypothetical protein
MEVMLGRMRATVGYANHPGPPCVEKGRVVIIVPATNMPPGRGIDIFVSHVDNPGNSIGVTWDEVTVFEEIEGCHVCEVCDELCDSPRCNDCEEL